jgi:PAS domain S-box-containing protein
VIGRWLRSLTTRIVLPSLCLAALVGGAFLVQRSATEKHHRATQQRAAADRDIARVDHIERLVLELQSGVQGYLLTRDHRFLARWRAASRAFPARVAELVRSETVDAGPRHVVEQVGREGLWYIHSYAGPLIRKASTNQGRLDYALDQRGRVRVDYIRSKLGMLVRTETREARKGEQAANDAASVATSWQLAALVGSLLLIILFVIYLTTAVSRPIRRVARAADRLAGGDLSTRVPSVGTQEVAGLSRSFNAMAETVEEGRDRLERQQGELERSETFLESVLEQIPHMIFVKDAQDLRFVRLNQATEELLGYSPDELLGKNDHDFFPPDQAEFFTAKDREVLASHEVLDIPEEPIRTKSGELRYLHTKKLGLYDADGKPQYLLGISEDITERKRSEQIVQQARKEAVEANVAKSEFLSRMSHELRTPLNAILGFGQLLEMEELGARESESVEQIVRAGRQLLELINEVLDISRIEAGELSISLEPVDVVSKLGNAVSLLGPLARERGVELIVDDGWPDHRYVLADRQRLRQVILNLVSNAIKYNHAGGTVRVSLRGNEERLRVVVEDTGAGIAPDRLTRLFEPFDRLGAEQTDVEGTGLGLAVSKRLVEAMGGTIGAESEPGAGSTFFLELAVAHDPGAAEAFDAAEAAVEAAADAPDLGGSTLLHIEDNPFNLRLVEHIFARRGDVRLLSATRGMAGLDLARRHRPDLILLDLHLPDVSGAEVLTRLRNDDATRDTPVILVSADATAGQIERLRTMGATAYVTKPLDVARFLELIGETLAPDGSVRS